MKTPEPSKVSADTPFSYGSGEPLCSAEYLTPEVLSICRRLGAKRILDLGCGNGALCRELHSAGFAVTGCDPSKEGIYHSQMALPGVDFHQLGVYDDPVAIGTLDFDLVVSTEVIEHLYHPAALPQFAFKALRPGGYLILSTPYHGYLKNLAISLFNKWDSHFTAGWDGGHIKFWSKKTLTRLLISEGFSPCEFTGIGRAPFLWKSMILVVQKPN